MTKVLGRIRKLLILLSSSSHLATLRGLLTSDESQFVAVYGRRRVGKTFLIREAFNYDFVFQHTGTYGATRQQQLSDFRESLYNAGMVKCAMPKTWSDAFHLLWDFLKAMSVDGKKKVVFIDELPWMDTPKSNFVRSLDHFWNAWATTRKDIILVVCGSATSWIIDNVILDVTSRRLNPCRMGRQSLRACLYATRRADQGSARLLSRGQQRAFLVVKDEKDPVSGRTIHKGAQIDLLIDRNDDTINLCEIKYTNAAYTLTEDEDERIRNRKETFIRETRTQKSVLITMITAFGLMPGGYADDIHCQLTMADLFR